MEIAIEKRGVRDIEGFGGENVHLLKYCPSRDSLHMGLLMGVPIMLSIL